MHPYQILLLEALFNVAPVEKSRRVSGTGKKAECAIRTGEGETD
jgi:hypothetical protein